MPPANACSWFWRGSLEPTRVAGVYDFFLGTLNIAEHFRDISHQLGLHLRDNMLVMRKVGSLRASRYQGLKVRKRPAIWQSRQSSRGNLRLHLQLYLLLHCCMQMCQFYSLQQAMLGTPRPELLPCKCSHFHSKPQTKLHRFAGWRSTGVLLMPKCSKCPPYSRRTEDASTVI